MQKRRTRNQIECQTCTYIHLEITPVAAALSVVARAAAAAALCMIALLLLFGYLGCIGTSTVAVHDRSSEYTPMLRSLLTIRRENWEPKSRTRTICFEGLLLPSSIPFLIEETVIVHEISFTSMKPLFVAQVLEQKPSAVTRKHREQKSN